jgi:hypothetical protein
MLDKNISSIRKYRITFVKRLKVFTVIFVLLTYEDANIGSPVQCRGLSPPQLPDKARSEHKQKKKNGGLEKRNNEDKILNLVSQRKKKS